MAADPELLQFRRDMQRYHERSMLAIEKSQTAIEKSQAANEKGQAAIERCDVSIERATEEIRLSRLEYANNRAVMRDLSAEIRASIEEGRRHSDAIIGALTDLAAEIRGWGGASRN